MQDPSSFFESLFRSLSAVVSVIVGLILLYFFFMIFAYIVLIVLFVMGIRYLKNKFFPNVHTSHKQPRSHKPKNTFHGEVIEGEVVE
ncbi:hypothetical protein COY07_03560 [Candidatus Peregrinibacteria bacterium CG_4_10_14_0_2_um_filter_43_11]|nr:MAG: hypothetical protein COY07_03560 [Candidatus Peregrinibacteria bacterium CG_4_10_14_0_2_um_filter_43_11]